MKKYIQQMIGDFEFHLMHQHYMRQSEEDSPWVRGKTIHEWIWSVMKMIHYMSTADRNRLYMHVVGDYNKYSLNPSARRDPIRSDKKRHSYMRISKPLPKVELAWVNPYSVHGLGSACVCVYSLFREHDAAVFLRLFRGALTNRASRRVMCSGIYVF